MVRDNLLITKSFIDQGVGLLQLEGELIAETRYEPERIMRDWLNDGLTRVIIQCTALKYLDSAGLSMLLGALHRFRRQGGDLTLCDMNPSINAIFEITSMEKYFKIFDTLEAARAHFGQMTDQHGGDPAQSTHEVE